MEHFDYTAFRDHLAEAIAAAGFQVRTDEVVYLNDASRGCEILVYPDIEHDGIWGKLAFEWMAENQALFEDIDHEVQYGESDVEDMDLTAAQVAMHADFHLHLDAFDVSTEIIRDVAEIIKTKAEEYFEDEGSVVAEVRLTTDEAKLECLRFEVNASGPFVSDRSWWEQWGEIFSGMLEKLGEIYGRLDAEFGGPARGEAAR